ncbi:hypothetical protein Rumeso_00790 [Rubellimicrobium mesophilum DSM 19309]|uniref:Uncharacterized protein n=1 Tax=Rubellimicrobium mesophilum DSM 19309 TaxID=442562 RepID=A0A017HV62_9RHOB|nr:hypothetical protein [Rubellimicrobium mesophilum]EYD77624.1 hypothetical protein Rumeso_00790 [Rubellimicrobium mesophilum DSM 19309]
MKLVLPTLILALAAMLGPPACAQMRDVTIRVADIKPAIEDQVRVVFWFPIGGEVEAGNIASDTLDVSAARRGALTFEFSDEFDAIKEADAVQQGFVQVIALRNQVPVRASGLILVPLSDPVHNGALTLTPILRDSVIDGLEETFGNGAAMLGQQFNYSPLLVVSAITLLFDEKLLSDKAGYELLGGFLESHKEAIRNLDGESRAALFAYLAGHYSGLSGGSQNFLDYAEFYIRFYNQMLALDAPRAPITSRSPATRSWTRWKPPIAAIRWTSGCRCSRPSTP